GGGRRPHHRGAGAPPCARAWGVEVRPRPHLPRAAGPAVDQVPDALPAPADPGLRRPRPRLRRRRVPDPRLARGGEAPARPGHRRAAAAAAGRAARRDRRAAGGHRPHRRAAHAHLPRAARTAAIPPPPPAQKRLLKLLARIALGAALLAAVIWYADPQKLGRQLAAVHPGWFAAAVLASIVSNLFSAARWAAIARGLGLAAPNGAAAIMYFRGMTMNVLLPGATVSGDLLRAYQL